MKILYIAANPDDQDHFLNLGPEVTDLQRLALGATGVEFIAMPGLKFEDLASTLHRFQPDILHIAAHGNNKELYLANQYNESVRLDAEMLRTFLSDKHPPQLIYLNACNSTTLAQALTTRTNASIGSTAPITVLSARAAARSFYEQILDGSSVERAFSVCKQVMRGISNDQAGLELFLKQGIDPNSIILHTEPHLIADFISEHPKRGKNDCYEIRFGVLGCPPTTKQVVFFTDDEESITKNGTLEEDLCSVVREPPRRGLVRMEKEDAWDIDGDFRIYAIGVSGDGRVFALSTMLCEALEEHYLASHGRGIPSEILEAIADLRRTDGSQLR